MLQADKEEKDRKSKESPTQARVKNGIDAKYCQHFFELGTLIK